MDFNITHDSVSINEVIFEGVLEQSVELDYLLPDYCQSIFKVLRCKATPKITSERIQNGKLLIEGITFIETLYASEDNYQIRSVFQKQAFSKTIELKENCDNPVIRSFVQCEYLNCRAVNPKRLDIRGALSIKIAVSASRQISIVSDALGMGIQTNKRQFITLDKKLFSKKEFTVKDTLELASGKPPIGEIINYSAFATLTEHKLIANKVVSKGEIKLHILYCPQQSDCSPEIMEYTIPFSQIIDLPGATEEYMFMIDFDVINVEFNIKQNDSGEAVCIEAEFSIKVSCEGNKNINIQLIDDIFSTSYDISTEAKNIKVEQLAQTLVQPFLCKNTIEIPQDEISQIYDINCNFTEESSKLQNGEISILGNMNVTILALDTENMPCIIEKSTPCQINLLSECKDETAVFSKNLFVSSVSYTLISPNEIEIRTQLQIFGSIYKTTYRNLICEIEVDDTKKKQKDDYAVLRLYFANQGESIWEIAKKFNTSMQAIIDENDLQDEIILKKSMILVPITD